MFAKRIKLPMTFVPRTAACILDVSTRLIVLQRFQGHFSLALWFVSVSISLISLVLEICMQQMAAYASVQFSGAAHFG